MEKINRFTAMKSGQITVFLVVGLLLLGIVGVLFFLVNNDDSNSLQTQQNQALNARVTERLVTDCLKRVGEEALFLIGMQGGNLYTDQGGKDIQTNTHVFNTAGEDFLVGFGILRNENEVAPPNYPVTSATSVQSGYEFRYSLAGLEINRRLVDDWGDNNLPKLCDRFGENSPDNFQNTFSCEFYTYGTDGNTIQNKIETYITDHVPSCIFGSEQSVNSTTNFAYENNNATVLITDNDVTISYEVNSNITQQSAKTILPSVKVTLPIRLKRVYNMLYYTIENDIRNVSFNKETDYRDLDFCNYGPDQRLCWDSDLVVSVIRGPTDIIRIQDTASDLAGRSYSIVAAVENRPPMLEYIAPQFRAPSQEGNFNYIEAGFLNSDIPFIDRVLLEGEELVFQPTGFDPDEDNLDFEYAGWKSSELMNSDVYQYGVECENVPDRCAKAFVASDDVNTATNKLHDLQIRVSDGELFDFQPLKIHVFEETP